MDWKDFFKPDWKKLLIALILFFVILFFPIPFKFYPSKMNPAYYVFQITFIFNALKPAILSGKIIILVGLLIMAYLLSCTIVFAYNQYKK